MDNIVIVGSSGHAKVVIDIIESEKKHQVVGLLDPNRSKNEKISGYPILGKDHDLPDLIVPHAIKGFIIGIADNFRRSEVAKIIHGISPYIEHISAIHPSASIASGVTIGSGTVVMAGAVINTASSVGRCCIVNTKSSLDHESKLKDFASLAPNATTGGKCQIGEFSAICIGATLLHNVTIGEKTVIGAGSLVLKNIGPSTVAFGSPAKIIRHRNIEDVYL